MITLFAALVLSASLLLLPYIGTELMPQSDEGEIRVDGEMEVGTRLELLDEKTSRMEEIVRAEVPEIRSIVSSVGGSHWRGSASTGNLRISLIPLAERKRSSEEIAQVLRRKLGNIPGMKVRVRTSSGLFIFRRMTRNADKVQVEIRGYDMETADVLSDKVMKAVEKVDDVTDADVSRDTGVPEEQIIIDRRKAADMKLTVRQIAEMLQTVLSGTRAGNFREAGNEYAIRVQVKDAMRMDLSEILDLTLANSKGEPVVLRNVVEMRPRSGPMRIERLDQERVVTVSGNVSGRDMGSIVEDIRVKLQSVPVPRGFSIMFGGEYEEQQKAFMELLVGFILALILVYMVMASLYESVSDPFVVMFSVPFAVIGVILILLLSATTLNIQSFIGCIMLAGIVVNNAILLVDTTNLLRRRDGMEMYEAIEEAGRRRLRPVLMTALTTILGLTPLALGLGEGGEAQAPMARAVIGGLISSTIITLVFVPVVYSFIKGFRGRKPAQLNGEEAAPGREN